MMGCVYSRLKVSKVKSEKLSSFLQLYEFSKQFSHTNKYFFFKGIHDPANIMRAFRWIVRYLAVLRLKNENNVNFDQLKFLGLCNQQRFFL